MKKTFLLILLAGGFFLSFSSFSQQTGNFEIELQVNGENRAVAFSVPLNYTPFKSYPLIIGIHGSGSNGAAMRELLNASMHQIEAILVCPDQVDIDLHHYESVDTVLNYCKRIYSIDYDKIILTGYSFGAFRAAYFVFDHSTSVRGIICIAPAIYNLSALDFSLTKNFGSAIIVGSEDDFISETHTIKNLIENNQGKLLYIEKSGVEHVDPYYSSLDFTNDWLSCLDFLFSNTNSVDQVKLISKVKAYRNKSSNTIQIQLQVSASCEIQIDAIGLLGHVLIQPRKYSLHVGWNAIELRLPADNSFISLIRLMDQTGQAITLKLL